MLQTLHIENIAIIESVDISFDAGLTVLSGETGAGKSILIDSIGAILGARTNRDCVRSGARAGFVSAVFRDLSSSLLAKLEELDLLGEERDTLHIQRQITADGKSTCRVNMRPAPVATLKLLAPYLINIHGQHDGQKLLDPTSHISFLDFFADTQTLLAQYIPHYKNLHRFKQEIVAQKQDEQMRLQRMDALRYHLAEIESAKLVDGEEETLLKQKNLLDHSITVLKALTTAHDLLDGNAEQDTAGAVEQLACAVHALSPIGALSPAFQSIHQHLEEVHLLSREILGEMSTALSRLDIGEMDQEVIESRLDTIYQLKQKYGQSIAEILLYAQTAQEELSQLEQFDANQANLLQQYQAELQTAKELAHQLTERRRQAGALLEQRLMQELHALNMPNTNIVVEIQSHSKLSARGQDQVQFFISANTGEALRPLEKVSSGGELSRIMLAMKNVLTDGEDVGTLIFDEIDTGVSGQAAQKIAGKLHEIGQKKQTLCVTHLPQIAAMGDAHLLIEKGVHEGRSFTRVHSLTQAERAHEIARMISGEHITDASLHNADELLKLAKQHKPKENPS